MTDTFKCSMCGEENEKGWTDEEAVAELEENFPGFDTSECDIVCDDCYQKLGLS